MEVYDDGSGPALYVGGDFATADGSISVNDANLTTGSVVGLGVAGIARWLTGRSYADDEPTH